jgi:hypothetical protein
MPGNPRAIITEAESRFPIRIAIRVPLDGFGQRYAAMCLWLDEICGIKGWSLAPAGTRGILNDAVAVYVKHRLAPWALWPAGPPGFYALQEDEPGRRVPMQPHKIP